MICTKCGTKNPGNSQNCENCGALVNEEQSIKEVITKKDFIQSKVMLDANQKATSAHLNQNENTGFIKGNDGILRWIYEMNMWKNPTLVITIWKVLVLAAMIPPLFLFFLTLGDGITAGLSIFFRSAGLIVGIVSVLLLLAYPFIALINGGKYCVVFEMDDHSVKHIQMKTQFKKNQVLAMITSAVGLMTGNIQATAAGLLAGSKQSSLSNFSKVKTIVVQEKRHAIYINEKFLHNQVYADSDNFRFVSEHIISHCKNAKVKYK